MTGNIKTNYILLSSFSLIIVILSSASAVYLQKHAEKIPQQTKLKISVYYESKCPDSIKFIKGQLHPVYSAIPDHLELDLVPYGIATTIQNPDGSFDFECQHGPAECKGNKIHACAISKLTQSQSAAFINCSMSQKAPELAGEECSKLLTINYAPIQECSEGKEGSLLLNQNGIRTKALNPKLYWVPWIMYDGIFYDQLLDASQADLLPVVCGLITGQKPSACQQYSQLPYYRSYQQNPNYNYNNNPQY